MNLYFIVFIRIKTQKSFKQTFNFAKNSRAIAILFKITIITNKKIMNFMFVSLGTTLYCIIANSQSHFLFLPLKF